jgi:hypothetical protein
MSAGARTPEELETMFEDALVNRDPEVLAELFEEGAVLAVEDNVSARGGGEIARLALTIWADDRTFVADPQRILQAREIALVVAETGVNVARRSRDSTWKFVIVSVLFDDRTRRRRQ